MDFDKEIVEVITSYGLGRLVARWWGPPITDWSELHVQLPDGRLVIVLENNAVFLKKIKKGPYR